MMTLEPGDLVRLSTSDVDFPIVVSMEPFRCRMFYPTGEDEDEPGVFVGTLRIDDIDCTVVLHRSRILITYPHRWHRAT